MAGSPKCKFEEAGLQEALSYSPSCIMISVSGGGVQLWDYRTDNVAGGQRSHLVDSTPRF